jgi:uncharacterized membrane protein YeaQ/YmgE (transglycosylase-associated protein family)
VTTTSTPVSFGKEVSKSISFTQVLIWILIVAVVGVVGELLARRRTPDGIVGAIIVWLLAIFLMVGSSTFTSLVNPSWRMSLYSARSSSQLSWWLSGAVLRTVVFNPPMRVTLGVEATLADHGVVGSREEGQDVRFTAYIG